VHPVGLSEGVSTEPLFFGPTPGPGDSEGGDVYPPEQMSGTPSVAFQFGDVAASLEPGGYEVVYETDRLHVGIYLLQAPEPDMQQPHEWDELYFVLEGSGTLTTEGANLPLGKGAAAFVPARAEHRFVDYERIVLLVVFDK
jgi:mannose-6-phosphate isomerase-like protein (cupin superfamily)